MKYLMRSVKLSAEAVEVWTEENWDVVVYLTTSLCSVTKLRGGDVPTSVRDCSEPRIRR